MTAPAPSSPSPARLQEGEWLVRAPEGVELGPVAAAELEKWVAEGRIDRHCFLRPRGEPVWRSAETWFAELAASVVPAVSGVPAAAAASPVTAPRPHRGAWLLLLAVVSWVSCPLLGVAAWWLASHDLAQMRSGQVDPAGAPAAQAAQIVGLTHAIASLVVILVGIFVGLVGWLSRG